MRKYQLLLVSVVVFSTISCKPVDQRIPVIFDTDANNELDDQHAIAYLLMNQDTFNVLGITTNVTVNGTIQDQCDEVRRVATLVGKYGDGAIILPGATANFEDILSSIDEKKFDGSEAVDFIIESARNYSPDNKLTLIPVGKLTNVALALAKAPDIIPNLRVVWLGSNYPYSGEHNLVSDIPSMNYVLDTDVQFEVLVCRYGKPSGTDAVRVSIDRVRDEITGKGPKASTSVTGRHGGEFTCFGDYSLNLFEHIGLVDGQFRALFDLCAVAVVKNPSWGETYEIPCPVMIEGQWIERPDNPRKIKIWENFDSEGIISDFIETLDRE